MGARPQDPHNVSHSLDEATSERIAERLESRGRDAVFQGLFRGYFPALRGAKHVVELGCGTGVVLRALLREEGFEGVVTGLDQSGHFLAAATRLAAAEGCSPERCRFAVADAHKLGELRLEPAVDAVVLNTLLSHVNDPAEVLRSARRLAPPGALLVVMDGDYSSLTYAHTADEELGRRMDAALVRSVYSQPDVMRKLPGLLQETGWRLNGADSKCVSEVGSEASYWVSFAKAYMPTVKQAGLMTESEVDGWWAAQEAALREGRFFAAASYYTMLARAV